MGRWVTTSQGRRLYIPDEGEENPYTKQIDKEIADKERQIAASKAQADQKKQEDFVVNSDIQKMLDRKAKNKEKYRKQRARRTELIRAAAAASRQSGNSPKSQEEARSYYDDAKKRLKP